MTVKVGQTATFGSLSIAVPPARCVRRTCRRTRRPSSTITDTRCRRSRLQGLDAEVRPIAVDAGAPALRRAGDRLHAMSLDQPAAVRRYRAAAGPRRHAAGHRADGRTRWWCRRACPTRCARCATGWAAPWRSSPAARSRTVDALARRRALCGGRRAWRRGAPRPGRGAGRARAARPPPAWLDAAERTGRRASRRAAGAQGARLRAAFPRRRRGGSGAAATLR